MSLSNPRFNYNGTAKRRRRTYRAKRKYVKYDPVEQERRHQEEQRKIDEYLAQSAKERKQRELEYAEYRANRPMHIKVKDSILGFLGSLFNVVLYGGLTIAGLSMMFDSIAEMFN